MGLSHIDELLITEARLRTLIQVETNIGKIPGTTVCLQKQPVDFVIFSHLH